MNCKLKFLSTPGYYLLLPSDTAFHWGGLNSYCYTYICNLWHSELLSDMYKLF